MYKATLEASKYLQLERRSNRDMPSAISRPFRNKLRNRAFPTPASASPSQSVTALFGFVRGRAAGPAHHSVAAGAGTFPSRTLCSQTLLHFSYYALDYFKSGFPLVSHISSLCSDWKVTSLGHSCNR
jgi:hypothetical protein